jgi:hypothetical protein
MGGKSPADEMADRILTASRNRVIEAVPDAVRQASKNTGLCTPEQADQIAAAMQAELRQPAQPERSPEVTRALAQIELDRQAAKDAGIYDARYERCLNTFGEMIIEAGDVDTVLEVIFRAMANQIAAENNLRLARANASADDQFDGQIIVWPESGLVLVPHSMDAHEVLDQLRAALGEDVTTHLQAVAAEYQDCPRCQNKMDLPGASRATPDREIKICGPCCSDEAMREAAGRPWPAVSEWPVSREDRA